MNNLGLSYHNLGDYEKAESFYRRSIEGNEVALGKDHPMTLSSITNLAQLFDDIEDYKNAIVQYKILIDLQNKQLGPEALDTFVSINNLGLAYYNCGDYENAESVFLEALAGYKKILEHGDQNIRSLQIT